MLSWEIELHKLTCAGGEIDQLKQQLLSADLADAPPVTIRERHTSNRATSVVRKISAKDHLEGQLQQRETRRMELEKQIHECHERELPEAAKIIGDLPGIALDDASKSYLKSIEGHDGLTAGNRLAPTSTIENAVSMTPIFSPSEDYTSIKVDKRTYSLTPLAGKIVRVLHEAASEGRSVSAAEIRRKAQRGKSGTHFVEGTGGHSGKHSYENLTKTCSG
jgi:hypothetical protein